MLISGKEIDHSHVESLLHNHGVFTAEVVAVI
jgi:hypothetical protein